MEDTVGTRARLTWTGADALGPDLRAALMGPGAPFELTVAVIRGVEQDVFPQAPRHLRAMFEATSARMAPTASFMVDGDRSWTRQEALADIDAVAALLRDEFGVGVGDRVAIVSANSPEYALTMWAVVTLGAIVTSLNGWWTGPEIAAGIALTDPCLVLGDAPRLARLEEGMVPSGVPVLTLADVHEQARSRPTPDGSCTADVEPDDPAVILFTSGTTGKAKGATLTHRNIIHFTWTNLLSGAIGAMTAPPPSTPPSTPEAPRQPASIVASPFFHVSGLIAVMMTGPAIGAKLVFPPPGRWDPVRHLQLTEEHGVSMWSGVPTQYWRLLEELERAPYDVSTVMSAGGGGAPFAPELIREMHRALPQAVLGNGYGMSETMGIGTLARGPLLVERPESVGVACPTVEVEVRDPWGRVVSEGEVGEIHLRSAATFAGYWNDPDATAACLDGDGWYRTGDFGRIEDGLLFLESRMRDLILRGGENIYPLEIEHRLVEHPDVQDAAVIGVDHPQLGQEVKAFVVVRPGATLTASDVQQWAAAALAPFKVPAHVEFRDSLPYTETGKLHKRVLEDDERQRR